MGRSTSRRIFSKLAGYDYDGWAVLEWECCHQAPRGWRARRRAVHPRPHHPRDASARSTISRASGTDEKANRRLQGERWRPVRRLRLGMVGGGEGAFIGGVHRIAARIDDQWELAAREFPVRSAKSPSRSASALGLDAGPLLWRFPHDGRERGWRAPIASRRCRIVTPNSTHHAIARAFLDAGIPGDLRQAADHQRLQARAQSRRGRSPRRAPALHPHAQLFRLSDDARRRAHGGGRRARQDPRRAGRNMRRTGWRQSRPATSRPTGAAIPPRGPRRRAGRYRHARLPAR